MTVPVGTVEPGGLLPLGLVGADELVLGELELVRARLPITLNVTVKPSLSGLVNFRFRGAEVSEAESMLSVPTLLL